VAAIFMAACSIPSAALAADFRSGDQMVVAQQGAPLKRGSETLATLSQGQKLKVLETDGDWVGTSAVVNGQTVSGWVYRRQVATPAQYAARRTTRRSYSYQPSAPSGGGYSSPSRSSARSSSNGQFIMGLTPYGRSYWRADRKISGY
jgi:hypothetical protein